MKKSDLENGMIVECRNGKKFMVIKDFTLKTERWGDIDIMLGNNSFINFNNYNDDLSFKGGDIDWNIVKVYCRKYLADMELKLLWECKEKPKIKITDDEIKLLEVLYNQGLRWMCRDYNTSILFFKEEPTEEDGYWDTQFEYFGTVSNMFAFMTEEDDVIYSIEELLKGE